MNVRRVRVSDTVTRYFVNASVGPNSRVMLVRPGDGTIITGWRTGSAATVIDGEWVSPFDDLIAVVRGESVGDHPRPAVLALVS